MDVLRRNTDYSLRLMINLAKNYNGKYLSARKLTTDSSLSYQHVCKLLQTLNRADLINSHMGPQGGFRLSRAPSTINLKEIIDVTQDGIKLNKCLSGDEGCEFEKDCEVNTKLVCLQLYIDGYFSAITLEDILNGRTKSTVTT